MNKSKRFLNAPKMKDLVEKLCKDCDTIGLYLLKTKKCAICNGELSKIK